MSTQAADLPSFLTRSEVADTLRLTTRQVDRLAAAGVLSKQKLSLSRSGFDRAEVERYLSDLRGSKPSPSASPSVDDAVADGLATQLCGVILVGDFGNLPPAFIDGAIAAKLPAAWVMGRVDETGADEVIVSWPTQMPYEPADVIGAIKTALQVELAMRRALAGG